MLHTAVHVLELKNLDVMKYGINLVKYFRLHTVIRKTDDEMSKLRCLGSPLSQIVFVKFSSILQYFKNLFSLCVFRAPPGPPCRAWRP